MACPSTPAVTQCPSTPAVTQCPSTPAVTQCPSTPAVTQCPSTPAVTQCPSTPATCAHTHNYNSLIGTVAPTCTKSGYHTLKCSCGATTTQTIPATGIHVYGTSWTNYSETQHMQVCLTCGGAPRYEAHATSGTCKCGKVITVPVQSVTISNGGSLDIKQTRTLTANVLPSNATNKAVTWSSSNTSVATVSSSGVVTAIDEGVVVITVRTNDGGYTYSTSIIVNEIPITKFEIIIE